MANEEWIKVGDIQLNNTPGSEITLPPCRYAQI